MSRVLNRELLVGGKEYKIGSSRVRVLERDNEKNIILASGSSLPADGEKGYAIGCLFLYKSGSKSSMVYINEGDTSSCDFNPISTSAGVLIKDETSASSGASAVPVTSAIHEITTTGTGDALTLADGSEGQVLKLVYVAEGAGTDTAVLTPSNLAGGTTITFNAVGDSCSLLFTNGSWYIIGSYGVTVA